MRKGLKVKYSVVLNRLQNLINYIPSQAELCNICKTKQSTMSNRANRDSDIPSDEIVMINDYYGINLYAEEVPSNNDSVTLDYYPDVFGSCGTGYFVSSEQKEQIQVPVNALFKSLSKGKKYSVINAKGNSMSPYIESGDRLIIEHLDNQPIIDNHVYIFCYDNDLLLITNKREQNKKQNSYKNYFQKTAYIDPQRYQTGETKRIEQIRNEKIEPMPPEFFKNLRAKLAAQCS
jgi:hypothetical protein